MTVQGMAQMSINTSKSYTNYAKAMQKGSSGYKINSAADDAAGLAISSSMKSQVSTSDQKVNNSEDAKSMSAVKEGALSSVSDSLSRIKDLATSASNTFYGSDEKSAIQSEINSLKDEIKGIYEGAEFNGSKLFEDGAFDKLGISDFDVTSRKTSSLDSLENAINKVSLDRGEEGATSNSLQSTIDYLKNSSYNLTSSLSKITDTDMAKMASKLSKDKTMSSVQYLMQNNQQNWMKQMQYGFLNMLA